MTKPREKLTKQTLSLYWNSTKKYPALLWPLLIIIPLNVVLGTFLRPLIIAQVLSRLSSGNYDPHHIWAVFGQDIILYAVASIFYGVVGWRVVAWLIGLLEVNVFRDLTQKVFAHLMNMSASFHSNRFSGSLVSQTGKLNGAYMRFVDPTAFTVIPLITSLIATAVILTPKAPVFVAVLIVLSFVFIMGTIVFSREVRQANADEAAAENRQTGYLADSVSNIMAVKTFSASTMEKDMFWEIGTDVRTAALRSIFAALKRQNYASIVTQALGISALFIAVVGAGILRANITTVFLIVSYTASLADQLWDFQSVLRQYNRSLGDSWAMVEILQIKPDITDPEVPEPSRMKAGNIQFKDVTFTHGDADEALFHNFSLNIKAGEKLGLVGRSGSGKTTLTRLLLRFSDLDEGAISIDGQDITKVAQDDLRRAISYVPQEPLLFHRTLRENIAYGKPEATEQEILRAAKRAHAQEFIDRLPNGYETLVGERGIKLSGGQRQRIAIARAMLKDAPILVLDEATSALDSESEVLIQDALWRLMEGRTAIVIAHRLSTIQRMDRIVVLDEGEVTEQGTHAELLKAHGIYAKLWTHQSGGFIDADNAPAKKRPVLTKKA
jgi:ATP-binding cassette subfamily B protein